MADRLARRSEPPGDPVHTASLDLRAAGGLESADARVWRDRFAHGARAARVRADPAAAARYAESAWTLLRSRPVSGGEVRLVHDEAMLAAAERGEAAEVEARFRSLLAVCRTPAEFGEAYRLCCHTAWLAGDEEASWRIAQEGMALFGVPPIARGGERRRLALAAARWRLSRSLPSWLQADTIRPEHVEPLGRVAETAGVLAYMRSPDLAALVALRVSARIKPRADHSPFWGSIEGFIRSMLGDPAGAARCGQLALAQLERGQALRTISAGSLYRIFAFGLGWSTPAHLLRRRGEDIREKALAEGDLSAAATAVRNGVMVGWRAASNLTALAEEVDGALEDCRRMMDAVQVIQIAALRRAIDLLQGRPEDLRRPPQLGRYPDGSPAAPLIEQELASVAGDWALARSIAEANHDKLRTFRHHPLGVYARFHGALAALKTGVDIPAGELRWLEKTAALNPVDHRLKPRLIRAEMLRRRGAREPALAAYAEAVELGDLGACRLEAGLAAECARDAALEFGDPALAERYQRRAEAVWRAWGRERQAPGAIARAEPAQADEVEAARAQAASAERGKPGQVASPGGRRARAQDASAGHARPDRSGRRGRARARHEGAERRAGEPEDRHRRPQRVWRADKRRRRFDRTPRRPRRAGALGGGAGRLPASRPFHERGDVRRPLGPAPHRLRRRSHPAGRAQSPLERAEIRRWCRESVCGRRPRRRRVHLRHHRHRRGRGHPGA
jgi:hypothetical protein